MACWKRMALHLDEIIQNVENANSSHQHAECWKLVNEISGRKSTKKGVLKWNSKSDTLKELYTHFSDLLCKGPVITDGDDEEIIAVLPDLDINTDPFTTEEYLAVTKRLIDDKTPDPDGIPPEIFKLCDIDEIMIEF